MALEQEGREFQEVQWPQEPPGWGVPGEPAALREGGEEGGGSQEAGWPSEGVGRGGGEGRRAAPSPRQPGLSRSSAVPAGGRMWPQELCTALSRDARSERGLGRDAAAGEGCGGRAHIAL